MRWYNWAASRRTPNTPARVLCNHALAGAGPAEWIELHPGVSHTSSGYAVWVVPWPGHAGGFYVDGLVYPTGKPGAHTQGKAFGLYDSPADAEYELLDVPHVEARLYEINFDDERACVLFQRVEWPESELFDDEDTCNGNTSTEHPVALTNEQANAVIQAAIKAHKEGRPLVDPPAKQPRASEPATLWHGLNNGVLPSGRTDEEMLATFDKNQRDRPVTRMSPAEKARSSLKNPAEKSSGKKPQG